MNKCYKAMYYYNTDDSVVIEEVLEKENVVKFKGCFVHCDPDNNETHIAAYGNTKEEAFNKIVSHYQTELKHYKQLMESVQYNLNVLYCVNINQIDSINKI